MDYASQLQVHEAKMDYASQLPDDVLSSILSRMTIKDAVKTSILSTRWRYLVASMLTLQFSLDMFGVNYLGPTCQPYYQKKFLEVVNQFCNFIWVVKWLNLKCAFSLRENFLVNLAD